jgi:Fic family protein
MFENIDILYQKLNSLPMLKGSSLQRIMDDFTVSYTYNSNAIEGNTLTEYETYMVINQDMTIADKPLRHHLDAIGHRDAFLYVLKLASDKTILSESVIKDVHRLVLTSDYEGKGRYRDVDVYISSADVIFPKAESVPEKMKNLLRVYESTMQDWHIIKRVALFHLMFESIHPFVDGNGRTGRLLLNFDLLSEGYPPIDIKLRDRNRYYYCLQAYQGADENEMPMIQMFERYVQDALIQRIQMLEKARDLLR